MWYKRLTLILHIGSLCQMWVLYVPVTLSSLHSMTMGIGWVGVRCVCVCGGEVLLCWQSGRPTKCALAAQRWNAYGRGDIRSCFDPKFCGILLESINFHSNFGFYKKEKKKSLTRYAQHYGMITEATLGQNWGRIYLPPPVLQLGGFFRIGGHEKAGGVTEFFHQK